MDCTFDYIIEQALKLFDVQQYCGYEKESSCS